MTDENGTKKNGQQVLDGKTLITVFLSIVPAMFYISYVSGRETDKIEVLQSQLANIQTTIQNNQTTAERQVDVIRGDIANMPGVTEKVNSIEKRLDLDERHLDSAVNVNTQNNSDIQGIIRTLHDIQAVKGR